MTRFFLFSLFLVFSFIPSIAQAACSNPAGEAGEQIYNADYKTMQFCDGTNWISMKGGQVTETDPKIGTLTEGKWCTVSGGKVVCTSDEPSGGADAGIVVGGGYFAGTYGNTCVPWGDGYCDGSNNSQCNSGSTKRKSASAPRSHWLCIKN